MAVVDVAHCVIAIRDWNTASYSKFLNFLLRLRTSSVTAFCI